MMEAPVPKTIKEVIRKIIPPKGIKRNTKGSKLMDGDVIAGLMFQMANLTRIKTSMQANFWKHLMGKLTSE